MQSLFKGADLQGRGSALASQQNLAIVTFESEMFGTIRTAGTAENPLFCLTDIGRVLEIKNINDCKSKLKQEGIEKIYTLTEGGVQPLAYINEQNLYKVIMRSNKPQAEPFQDWVCGEVLPQIRKTGGYIPVNAEDDEKTIMAKALQIMQRTLEQKDKLIEAKSRTIANLDNLARKALNSTLHYTVGNVAKELGFKTAGALYRAMEDKGYVIKVGKRKWMPTDKLASKFYFLEPYTYRKNGVEYEGMSFHLTEAFVVAMRAKRIRR